MFQMHFARRTAISWARSRDLTPQRIWPVLRERGGLEAFLSTPEGELAERLGSGARARAVLAGPEDPAAERWTASVEASGLRIVTAFDPEYPASLAEIADPPFLLFARGRLERLKLPAVAVVGSRNATRYGRDVAARLARELSQAGVTIGSGFARGVDAAAHETARGGPGGRPGGGAFVCGGGGGVRAEFFPPGGAPAGRASGGTNPSAVFPREATRLYEALRREESLSAEELAQSLDLPAATVLAG